MSGCITRIGPIVRIIRLILKGPSLPRNLCRRSPGAETFHIVIFWQ